MELNTLSSNKMKEREERRYSVPHGPNTPLPPAASEDLHAWSIYRQNLNSDFTDSALGSSDKSPLPYGNFQLRDTTVQSILNHPRYGPKSPLGSNMYTYLKFGLPRVFPPNAGSQRSHRIGPGPPPSAMRMHNNKGFINSGYRDSSGPGAGSSGYDSSDNETPRGRGVPPNLRKFRSESDFRTLGDVVHSRSNKRPPGGQGNNIPLAALRQANSRASIAGTHINEFLPNGKHYKNRSHSEADLLENDVMGYEYDMRNAAASRTMSEHYMTNARRQSASGLIYPNIQVNCLSVEPALRGISLEAKAGELFAIMATSQEEGTLLTTTIAGLKSRSCGEIIINGQNITQRGLRSLCSFVPAPENSSLDPRMSVKSTLNFHAALCGPMDKTDLKERINILVEDLGLSAVRTANVSKLTHSEKQRLSVACQLLTQASILILDQTTTNMDIFDTFFLVEYLRQWCNNGRIVIMTLQPPTFEILSMCSSVLLLSGGRTVFSGSRSDLPRHMGALGYPCPPFKNPADYYLDLVTLDNLSAAAMLESCARIESLAAAWERSNFQIVPAPAAPLPNFTQRAYFFGQLMALSKRFIVYKQPGSLLAWISKLVAAALLSIFFGCIFWDIPSSDSQLTQNDRLGYHHCIIAISFWPLLMLTIRDIHIDRNYAEKDISLGLYGRTVYIFVQSFFNLIPSLCIWFALLLPAHSMAALYSYTTTSDTGIYLYMGYMLLYLIAIQGVAVLSSHIFSTKTSSNVFTVIVVLAMTLVGGFSIHMTQIPTFLTWLQFVSPERWIFPILVANEYSPETLANTVAQQKCRNKQVQHQEIIFQHPCPPPNGTFVLADNYLLQSDHNIDPENPEITTVAAIIFMIIVLFILTCFLFILNIQKGLRKKKKFT